MSNRTTGWIRRQHLSPLQALLGISLTLVVCATPVLVLWEYSSLASTVGDFGLAQNVTGVLADSQRDSLLTVIAVDRLEGGGSTVSATQEQASFLGQQLRILDAQVRTTASEPKIRVAVEAQKDLSTRLDGLLAVDATPERAAVLDALPELKQDAAVAQTALHGMYAVYENAFFEDLSAQLRSGRDLQVLILGFALLSLTLGATLGWSLRQSVRRDFGRAYDLLAREAAERELAQGAVEQSERRFRALVQQSTDMTLMLDGDHRVTYASPSAETLLRATQLEPIGASISGFVHQSVRPLVAAAFRECMAKPGRTVQFDLPAQLDQAPDVGNAAGMKPDHYFAVQLTNLLDDPAIAGIIVNAHDITELTRHAAALEHLAYHDRLTGLPNRLSLERDLDALGTRSTEATIMVLELDGFRAVNERVGEQRGDDLLRDLGSRLSGLAGSAAFHLGGDEFALLCDRALHGAGVAGLVVDVRREVAATAPYPHGIPLSASIGVAMGSLGTMSGHELLRHADSMVHQAKQQGDGKLVVLDEGRTRAAAERGAMIDQLSHALERAEFELHFQPIVSAQSGTWVAVEALLRWRSPDGPVPPAAFIPIAEQTRLIVPIGRWVLATAAREIVRIRELTGLPLRVNVNVSSCQLQETDFIEHVLEVLAETGLDPDALVLELTESAVLEDPDLAVSVLLQARGAGMHVALDDFGTGYSSLSYLLRLPVDIVKVDRSFLRDVTTSVRTRKLLHALVDLAHQLDMRVTVEGVETEEENDVVVQAGCDTIQGFLLARPMPVAALVERATEAFPFPRPRSRATTSTQAP
ncbi:putative bifunctional diguanylate cyclase/phosphodiesterase [Pengzhenrongella phosphoraccumulans]|uniref:putative bifunctional diguanylate cyclase/phosphodiesterase n=1 Tax=Pengzhenrongella phosphoraccumulans TaxID=3114394 RepID=UPI0038911673